MELNELYNEINNIKIKSLTQNRPIQKNTIKKHTNTRTWPEKKIKSRSLVPSTQIFDQTTI